jgi:V8-like Glu-specific endopeptidase
MPKNAEMNKPERDVWLEFPPQAVVPVRSRDVFVIPLPEVPDMDGLDRQPKAPQPVLRRRRRQLKRPSVKPRTERVANTRVPPYAAVGKFFNFVGQNRAGHSTAFVLGHRLVFTAAHCVVDSQFGYEFVPNFGEVRNPRRWRIRHAFVHHKYLERGTPDYRYDLAICITEPSDVAIAPSTGKLGWELFNTATTPRCLSLGYPAHPPHEFNFDGKVMWQSDGAILSSDDSSLSAMQNDMTQGCSGGPWVVDRGENIGWVAVGLNSHVRSFDERVMWSPRFDDDFAYMIDAAKRKEREMNGNTPSDDPGYIRVV